MQQDFISQNERFLYFAPTIVATLDQEWYQNFENKDFNIVFEYQLVVKFE